MKAFSMALASLCAILLFRQVLQLLTPHRRHSNLRKASHLLLIAGYGGMVVFESVPSLVPNAAAGITFISTLIVMLAGGVLGIRLSAQEGDVPGSHSRPKLVS